MGGRESAEEECPLHEGESLTLASTNSPQHLSFGGGLSLSSHFRPSIAYPSPPYAVPESTVSDAGYADNSASLSGPKISEKKDGNGQYLPSSSKISEVRCRNSDSLPFDEDSNDSDDSSDTRSPFPSLSIMLPQRSRWTGLAYSHPEISSRYAYVSSKTDGYTPSTEPVHSSSWRNPENTILGRGTTSTVRLAMELDSHQYNAVKCIRKKDVVQTSPSYHEITSDYFDHISQPAALQELRILRSLPNHPGIAALKDVYESKNEIFLVMECCAGGDLFDRILDKGAYAEHDAIAVISCLLDAIACLHNRGIVHRDLKPENILLVSQEDDVNVKITDFGSARALSTNPGEIPSLVHDNSAFDESRYKLSAGQDFTDMGSAQDSLGRNRSRAYSKVGSEYYCAPEMECEEGYGAAVDIWSLGIITYIILCGSPPFEMSDNLHPSKKSTPSFTESCWEDVSERAKDFCKSLLTVNMVERPSAEEALNHPWLRGRRDSESSSSSLDSLSSCSSKNKRRHSETRLSLSSSVSQCPSSQSPLIKKIIKTKHQAASCNSFVYEVDGAKSVSSELCHAVKRADGGLRSENKQTHNVQKCFHKSHHNLHDSSESSEGHLHESSPKCTVINNRDIDSSLGFENKQAHNVQKSFHKSHNDLHDNSEPSGSNSHESNPKCTVANNRDIDSSLSESVVGSPDSSSNFHCHSHLTVGYVNNSHFIGDINSSYSTLSPVHQNTSIPALTSLEEECLLEKCGKNEIEVCYHRSQLRKLVPRVTPR